DAEHRARGDEQGRTGGERGRCRARAEDHRAEEEQPAPADPVAEVAHRDQHAGDEEAVDVDDPEQLTAGRVEVGADARQGEVEDREVHGVEDAGQRDGREPYPLAAAGLHARLRARTRATSSRVAGASPAARIGPAIASSSGARPAATSFCIELLNAPGTLSSRCFVPSASMRAPAAMAAAQASSVQARRSARRGGWSRTSPSEAAAALVDSASGARKTSLVQRRGVSSSKGWTEIPSRRDTPG